VTTWKPTPPRREEQEATPLASSLAGELRRLGGPDPVITTAVFAHWEQLVGPALAAHARPLSLRDGVLVVAVDQPAWATQIRFLGADIVARITEATGRSDVTALRVRVEGEVPRRNSRR
jgi:predicted nucleic acid-binding Zn ribbon protein